MELNRKAQHLRTVFLKYLISIAIGLVLTIGLSILILEVFYQFGYIVPANYTENLLISEKSKITSADYFDKSMLPDNTNYIFVSKNGEIEESNMRNDIEKKAINFHNREGASNYPLSFMEIKRPEGYLIISYYLRPYYTNPWMESHLPQINTLYLIMLMVFCFIMIFVITVIYSRRLTKELRPILVASEKISEQNLDFKIGKTSIKEFNVVINGLEKMQVELSESLKKNWEEEENRKSQISALTHDIKTPLSIVRGNAELLNDTELTEEQETYTNFIIKNSNRISDYVSALMMMNKSNKFDNLDLEEIDISNVVNRIMEIAREITLAYNFTLLESINFDDGKLMVDIKSLERAIQNIFSNAIEYSPAESLIELKIFSTSGILNVIVLDSGPGFSKEDLVHGTKQFYRGDKSRHSSTNYGLGLFISNEIIEKHGGKLFLNNRSDAKGAEVRILMPYL